MSSRIRVFLLVALIVSTPLQSASACGLLSPFRWLFGCDHYGGYSCGSRESSYRLIDDWLGYGYLRNQQGTLGHYPGNWYRNIHPHMGRGYPMAGPLFSQPAPMPGAMNMPGPMAMPSPMPTGPVYTPNWNSGCDPCATPWTPSPVPVATMQPMTVDRGSWQMVWVPRPVTTMVPQTQWMMPGPSMPSAAWNECGCDTCETTFHGSSGQPMMHGGEMQSDCGCAGGSVSDPSAMPMSVPPAGAFLPPNRMSYGTSGYTVATSAWNNNWSTGYSGTPVNYAPPYTAWTPATTWNSGPYQPRFNPQLAQQGTYSGSWNNSAPYGNWQPSYQPQTVAQTWQPQYNTAMITPSAPYRGPVPSRAVVSTAFRPNSGYQPWQNSYPTARPWPSASPIMATQPVPQMAMVPTPQMAWGQPQMTAQTFPVQQGWSGMATSPGAPQYGAPAPRFAGDIMGDHEYPTSAQSGIIQNAYQGTTPVIRTGMNNSGQRTASRSYPNALH